MLFRDVVNAARNYTPMRRDKTRVKRTSEVFTPSSLIQEMCDAYESNHNGDWSGPIMDNAAGDGNFLSEVLLRKIVFYGKQDGVAYDEADDTQVVCPAHYNAAIEGLVGVEKEKDNVNAITMRLRMGLKQSESGEYLKGWDEVRYRVIHSDWIEFYNTHILPFVKEKEADEAKGQNRLGLAA